MFRMPLLSLAAALLALPAAAFDDAPWAPGRQWDGGAFHAGRDIDAGRAGFYYRCDGAGRSEFVLWGRGSGSAVLEADIDGKTYRLDFAQTPEDFLVARVAPEAAVLRALQGGRRLVLREGDGFVLLDIGLTGAAHSLGATLAACRSPGR